MTQEQEFEFRARAEAEAARKPSAAPRVPYNTVTDLQNIYARRTREGAGRVAEGLKQGGWGGFGKALMGGVDYISSPISAAQELVVGRPIETATGGVIPANVAGDVAGMVSPFAPLAISKAAQGGRALAGALKYGTKAKPAIEAVRGKALAELLAQKQAASGEAALATEQARRAETKAATLANRQTAAASKATPAPFSEGRVTTLDERGQPIQTDVVKAKEDIIKARSDERTLLEAPIIKRVKAKEAAGESIADTPEAKTLLKDVRNKLNPSLTESSTITSKPTNEQARVYSYVDEVLSNRREPITAKQAAAGKEKGQDIIKVDVTDPITNEVSPTFYRVFKTQYEAVDNLRRRFGDAYHGKDATGFEGVSENLIKDMYGKIRNIQKNYVGEDLYNPLQESYAKYTKALAPFNETQIGKSISGTQGTTDIANLTPSQVPGAVLSKGAGGFEQVQALGGNPTKALADEVATAFYNPKTNAPRTSEEVRSMLYNTNLGSAVNANPTVKAAVAKHLTQLQDAEMAGVKAENFKVAGEKAAKKATQFAETSTKAKASAETFQKDINDFETLQGSKQVLSAAREIVKKYVPSSQQTALFDEINNAYKLNKEKGIRNWVKTSLAAGALGLIGFKGTGALLNKTSAE